VVNMCVCVNYWSVSYMCGIIICIYLTHCMLYAVSACSRAQSLAFGG